MNSSGPTIGDLMAEFISLMDNAASPDEKAAIVRVAGDMFEDFGLGIMVAVPTADDSDPVVVFTIPDVSDKVAMMFAGSPWAKGGWAEALSTMPGAFRGITDVSNPASKATFVPVPALVEAFGFGQRKQ